LYLCQPLLKPVFVVKTSLLIGLLSLLSGACWGQNPQNSHRCGTDSVQALLMGLPGYEEAWRDRMELLEDNIEATDISNRGECNNPLIIPVAVHFQGVAIDQACATDMALDQVERLNLDFAGTNADIAAWNAIQGQIWPAINNGESCICFCLASLNHPAGFGLGNGDYAVTIDQTAGDNDAAWSGYLNFWVREIGGGTLGYSPLGGTGNGDGVTCGPSFFGSVSCGGNAIDGTYNLGRTITHEVGHYLSLEHPWGGGGCASNDFVNDTPVTDGPTFGCPAQEFINCTDPVLWPSYMDYCDDQCMFMFSQGQVERMETYVNGSLTNLLNNSVTVCQESACLGFDVSVTIVDESCDGNDGLISINANGGTEPYSYSINGGASTSAASAFNALDEGVYTVYVIDDFGCEFTQVVNLDRDGPDIDVVNVDHEYCSDGAGSIEVSVGGNSVFEYWLTGVGVAQDEPIFSNLSSALYTVNVANAAGCSGSVQIYVQNQSDLGVQIEEFKAVNCSWFDNGSIDVAAIGGLEPYTYTLNDTEDSPIGFFDELSVGVHHIFMTDDEGCVLDMEFEMYQSFSEMDESCPCTIYIPNAITVDGDGDNETLVVIPSCPIVDYNFKVFNRWGVLLFESTDLNRQWNGGLEGYYVSNDVYVYHMTWRWGDSTDFAVEYQTRMGYVTVIR
jgi:gliding motility-associated-like protein